ncbi:hypothetical protein E2C01_043529 [Portunus trituberculatus]|uniref:Uncharacterized protein n=1 Tax=Portunus trituberculatus TaxID=210409 RepID=A0A5B7FWD1_PORTR|nr:hypothetical protein [Portunus trituberculatus]
MLHFSFIDTVVVVVVIAAVVVVSGGGGGGGGGGSMVVVVVVMVLFFVKMSPSSVSDLEAQDEINNEIAIGRGKIGTRNYVQCVVREHNE